jgi:DNA polymerase III gamma/tau subunit
MSLNTPRWFSAAIDEVNTAFAAQRLAHGLLIHEDPGAGGTELARWIAQRVNCTSADRAASLDGGAGPAAPSLDGRAGPAAPSLDGRARPAAPCGECQSCRWIEADQHPDVTMLSPEEDSEYIKIEPVRALAADLALTAHGRGYKIAILSPADSLYPNAANSQLKTLE